MQNRFQKKKPNTISRSVYYAASGLRATVPAGDKEYANIHKVYTIWLCAEDVVFRNGKDTAFIGNDKIQIFCHWPKLHEFSEIIEIYIKFEIIS